LPDFFTTNQNGYKIAIKIPNGHEIHQKVPSQVPLKCTKMGILSMKPSGNPAKNVMAAMLF
jgi:hypothetical protein